MQDFVFRNPADHVEEIKQSFDEFTHLLALYADQPKEINKSFLKLLYDLSHIIHHHPDLATKFADQICSFLETHPESLPHDVRIQLVQAVMVLHNKSVIDTVSIINKLIPLFKLNDKNIRRCIFGHFILKLPFHQTNITKRELQKFVSTDYDARIAFKVLQLIIDIFHKENTEDLKTINFVARCINSNDPRVINTIVAFFLDPYLPRDTSEIDLEEARKKAELSLQVGKKTKSREKTLEKIKKMKVPLPQEPVQVISFIDDPQKFSIRLFALLSAPENGKVFRTREAQLRAMSLLSKIIATFQLDFDQFFNWAARFVRPAYDEITKMLAIIASAVHPLTSPDTLEDLLRNIANKFVADHLDEEVIVIGLNTIREICAKNPHGMTETLLSDLIMYKKSNVKGVVIAARSLIQLYRDVNPDLLPKRERGKPTEEDEQKVTLQYGEVKVDTEIKGIGSAALERPITQEEFQKSRVFGDNDGDGVEDDDPDRLEVDEDTLLEGSRVHKLTREEKIEIAREGKSEHKFRDRMADKTAGFSNKEKLKNKPFRLTRFRHAAGKNKDKSLSAVQKLQKKREGIIKMRYS
ncbi:hypothetical protein TRFO_29382 [Tritrichomonas foetus]|uniref:Protein SDA1 n=1 Tax=Tritrichomonas foetus TaxID=1144522 RepID=A0A1J4JVX7_9EUKA|nr:hypothetical protein TRFO_29382 [Tritrichomonas foetus]|eukprot:OHT03289.1 hypothetical protein TRFO_29382 [Tritrichomonas foetus]